MQSFANAGRLAFSEASAYFAFNAEIRQGDGALATLPPSGRMRLHSLYSPRRRHMSLSVDCLISSSDRVRP
jgi:hypothetical protein